MFGKNEADSVYSNDILLDPNHTHFIFVDDGSEGQYGKEIEFRSKLEDELRYGKDLNQIELNKDQNMEKLNQKENIEIKIPMVLIVVQGDSKTLSNGTTY